MAKNTIKLKKYLDIVEEYEAAGTITPGMLVEYTSAGKVQAHSTAEGNAVTMVALEDELQGNGIDDDYSADDQVQVWIPQRGAQAYMILADGQDVSKGDFLESNGAGLLQKHVTDSEKWSGAESGEISVYPNAIVAQALEDLDISGESSAESSALVGQNKNIKVRII